MYNLKRNITDIGIEFLFDNDTDSDSPKSFNFSSGVFKIGSDTILTTGNLTTSSILAGLITDESGSGSLIFGTSPSITIPTITGGTISNTSITTTSLITKGTDIISGNSLLTLTSISASKTLTVAQTNTLSLQIPSGAMLLGVQLRNDTIIAGTDVATGLTPITTYSAIYATGATQSINATILVAKNTKVNKFFDVHAATNVLTGLTDITLDSGTGNQFTVGGIISAVAYYYQFTSITDAI